MITGAGNGLGHEMALHLAGCGAELVIADIDEQALAALSEKIQAISGNTPLSVLLDVSSEEQWQAAASSVQEHFGYLTGLVKMPALCCMFRFNRQHWINSGVPSR